MVLKNKFFQDNDDNSVPHISARLLNSPKVNCNISTSKTREQKTHMHKEKVICYRLDSNENSISAVTPTTIRW
jgi:hypothetical protein